MLQYKYKDFIEKSENIAISKNAAVKNEDKHTHEFIELVYTISGSAIHYIQDKSYEVKSGDLIFINYNEKHSFEIINKLTYVNILIKPEFMSNELINSENIYDVFSIFLSDGFDNTFNDTKNIINFTGNEYTQINFIINNMLLEFEEKKPGYKSILNGYMRIIFAKLIRKIQNNNPNAIQKKYINKITPEIMSYIDENCFEKVSLKKIAEKSFYNPSYFSRIFKEYCGQSLTSYIQKKRIDEAIILLKTTDWKIDTICESIGYSEKKLFFKLFKEQTGITPTEYRKIYF